MAGSHKLCLMHASVERKLREETLGGVWVGVGGGLGGGGAAVAREIYSTQGRNRDSPKTGKRPRDQISSNQNPQRGMLHVQWLEHRRLA